MLNELLVLIGIIIIAGASSAIDDYLKRNRRNADMLRSQRWDYFGKHKGEISYDGDLGGDYALVTRNDRDGDWRYTFFGSQVRCRAELDRLAQSGVKACDWCEFTGSSPIGGIFPHISLEKRYGKPVKSIKPKRIIETPLWSIEDIEEAGTSTLELMQVKYKDDPLYQELMWCDVEGELDLRREAEEEKK